MTPLIEIASATSGDLAEIEACASKAYAKYVEAIGRPPAPMIADFASQIRQGQVCVAKLNGRFAGYIVFYPAGINCLHLENVAVLPEMSGQGVGKRLIEYVEAVAVESGLTAIELYTNELMVDNLRIYPHLGYAEIERRREDGFSRVFFRKEL